MVGRVGQIQAEATLFRWNGWIPREENRRNERGESRPAIGRPHTQKRKKINQKKRKTKFRNGDWITKRPGRPRRAQKTRIDLIRFLSSSTWIWLEIFMRFSFLRALSRIGMAPIFGVLRLCSGCYGFFFFLPFVVDRPSKKYWQWRTISPFLHVAPEKLGKTQ